ncbi:MAG: hypothetical protein H0T78_05320 [Longispora sp.]|nr:hypothetical protein [Longispora sp. (in: high G+C Gram-positive bacteria)]
MGLAVYAGKLILVGLVLALLAEADWPGVRAMVFTVAAAVVVWTMTQTVWVWRARLPYVEIEPH